MRRRIITLLGQLQSLGTLSQAFPGTELIEALIAEVFSMCAPENLVLLGWLSPLWICAQTLRRPGAHRGVCNRGTLALLPDCITDSMIGHRGTSW